MPLRKSITTAIASSACLFFLHPLRAQVEHPLPMQDKHTFDAKYDAATDSLKSTQRLPSVIVDHDQEVLQGVYTDLKPKLEKKGFTRDDSAAAVVNAWFTLRSLKDVAPDTGITKTRLDEFLIKAEPVVIDSAPRGAEVMLIPDGGLGPIKTRNTVFLKPGARFTLRFSLPGFADYTDTITAGSTDPVICRELRPLDPKTSKSSCPK